MRGWESGCMYVLVCPGLVALVDSLVFCECQLYEGGREGGRELERNGVREGERDGVRREEGME